jgi:hypothetical protein
MKQGLFGVVTRIGTAFVEDQIVLLELKTQEYREGVREWRKGWEVEYSALYVGTGSPPCSSQTLELLDPLLSLDMADLCLPASITDAGSVSISWLPCNNCTTSEKSQHWCFIPS